MSAPYVHEQTLSWVLAALADGHIIKTEFEVLFFCCCKLQGADLRVLSYSAGQVCRFYNQDATTGNRQKYVRAWRSLRERWILYHDYRQGTERPYDVWLPRSNPFEIERESRVSLYTPLSHLSVSPSVSPRGNVTDVSTGSSEQDAQDVSQQMSQQNRGGMSFNTQGAESHPDSVERDPLNPLRGLHTPPPRSSGERSPLGSAQAPLGLKGCTVKGLNSEQVKKFHQIVDSFDLTWKQAFGFDPDAECNTRELLHDFSPWEIELAYESALGVRSTNMRHTEMKAFFVRTARKWIRTYRKNHCDDWGLDITSLRTAYNLREPDPAFDSIQYAWCNLFNQPVALRYWTDQRQHQHFYHPELYRLKRAWEADSQSKPVHQAAEQKRKANQEQALAAQKSQKEWEESQKRAQVEQRAKKIEEMNKEFSSHEWTFDGIDSWTARYGVIVRLCENFDQAEVIGPKGTRTHRSTEDVEELHGYACGVD